MCITCLKVFGRRGQMLQADGAHGKRGRGSGSAYISNWRGGVDGQPSLIPSFLSLTRILGRHWWCRRCDTNLELSLLACAHATLRLGLNTSRTKLKINVAADQLWTQSKAAAMGTEEYCNNATFYLLIHSQQTLVAPPSCLPLAIIASATSTLQCHGCC